MRIDIVEGDVSNFDIVIDILSEVSQWLSTIGVNQWSRHTLPIDHIRRQLKLGEVYLIRSDGKNIGTVTLQWTDEQFWGTDDSDAGYVHRMALRPAYVGRGIGHRVLTWAEKKALTRGRKFIRLNCLANSQKLREFYEREGFDLKRIIQEPRGRACLYEKTLVR